MQVRHVALARLENKCRVIAINDAIFVAWWADWLHGCDYKWWNWHRSSALKFTGIKTTLTDSVPDAWDVHLLKTAKADKEGRTGGFPAEADTVAGGGNGAFQCIQLAAKAGAKRILLLGVDMKFGEDKQSHWFGDHPDRIKSDYEGTMLCHFPSLVEPLAQRNVEVINCSPDSALKIFPAGDIKALL
jgi:hypothetical protein